MQKKWGYPTRVRENNSLTKTTLIFPMEIKKSNNQKRQVEVF